MVSFVDIGELVLAHMKPNMEVVWFNLVDHMYWSVEHVNGIRFGGEVEDGAYAWLRGGPTSYAAIFDSGTSASLIPTELFEPFITRLFKHSAQSVYH